MDRLSFPQLQGVVVVNSIITKCNCHPWRVERNIAFQYWGVFQRDALRGDQTQIKTILPANRSYQSGVGVERILDLERQAQGLAVLRKTDAQPAAVALSLAVYDVALLEGLPVGLERASMDLLACGAEAEASAVTAELVGVCASESPAQTHEAVEHLNGEGTDFAGPDAEVQKAADPPRRSALHGQAISADGDEFVTVVRVEGAERRPLGKRLALLAVQGLPLLFVKGVTERLLAPLEDFQDILLGSSELHLSHRLEQLASLCHLLCLKFVEAFPLHLPPAQGANLPQLLL
mmetsp:Transcript_74043/g.187781  ORF Transcript_74043/g.187781 Transcript_74043/m.187781 type:complete len:291 (+) Transcript_74043:689-1561(+)